MELKRITHAENVRLSDSGRAVRILDQSRLPNETVYLELSQAEDLYEAIASLRVRGAPAIGIFAGYALYVLALQSQETQYGPFLEACRRNRDYLNSSRPTAVNLRHMLDRVLAVAESMPCADVPSIQAAMGQAARAIHQEDIAMCTAISEYGLSLVKAGDGILTHCNAGPLATSRYGTGQGPFLLAAERGIHIRVFADETRPLLQGARLTSGCFAQMGFDTTVITDNMVAYAMEREGIDLFTSAADTIARDGHIANKIGTFQIAILAKYFGIPYYVTGIPDQDKHSKDDIVIEMRDPQQVLSYRGIPNTVPEVKAIYPSFDVVPPHLISGVVTDKGVYVPYLLDHYFDSDVKKFY